MAGSEKTVLCELCPHACVIPPGQSGDCRIRVNLDGILRAVTYGYPCAVHVDPVEKKPVYHFLPATITFSLATAGCNLHCKNCQNWEISQHPPDELDANYLPPEAVPGLAQQYGCASVSYTYSDPMAFYEYTLDTCVRARAAGLKNILVTAGYLNQAPLKELFQHVDSARIDLKSMSEAFYRDVCGGTLAPVLGTLELARKTVPEMEVIHLIIPTLNDSDEDLKKLCEWVRANLGREVPLHFSRFFPQYLMQHLPPTPVETLNRAYALAKAAGLDFVYIGNVLEDTGADTFCPACGKRLIRRQGYTVLENQVKQGRCGYCQKEIYGIWK